MRFGLSLILAALACYLTSAPTIAGAASGKEADAWRKDIRFLQREMPAVHPDLFHSLSRAEFDDSINALIERVPAMTQPEIITRLAAIIAAVGDGHTRLTLPLFEGSGFFTGHSETPPPASRAMMFHYLPIRLASYDDGLFVEEIASEHREFLGARVERIGSMSVADASERVSRVIHHDNDMQLRSLLPSRLVIPELLEALGVVQDAQHVQFELSLENSGTRKLVLAPAPEDSAVNWVDVNSLAPARPLYLRHRSRHFWFEYIEDRNAVFCQYNEVSDEDDESIAAFSARLTNFITEHAVDVLVLDLRFNRGGDNSLNRSFLQAVIGCPALQDPGTFFVIIGRNTFSAAMMLVIDLEKFTNAIFVGEPTGAKPNHFGDSRKIQLPNSGLTVRVSTLYWQYAGPKDERRWLSPHIPVRFLSDDARMGRDPALEKILEVATASTGRPLVGRWSGKALGYDIVVNVRETDQVLEASIDFPGEGATGLPLANVRYDALSLQFDFPNGDQVIHFAGKVQEDTIIGRVVWREQVYPWVMSFATDR